MHAHASEHWKKFKKANNISDSAAGPDALQNVVSGLRKCFETELGTSSSIPKMALGLISTAL